MTRYQPNLAPSKAPGGRQRRAGDGPHRRAATCRGSASTRTRRDRRRWSGSGAPGRAIIADGQVIVSLNQIDASYASYGDGAIVIIDPTTNMVTVSVALPGLYDCEGMDFVPAAHTLLVACGGAYASPDQPLQSGIAVVDLGRVAAAAGPRHLVGRVRCPPDEFRVGVGGRTAAAPTRAFAGTYDSHGIAPDAAVRIRLRVGGGRSESPPRPRSRWDRRSWLTRCCSSPRR